MACAETQQEKIVKYCAEHGSITVREAFIELGINSPTKRISELRHSLLHEVSFVDEYKDDKRWRRYFIRRIVP